MKETLLKTAHLSKFFGDFQAVKDVSFTVNKGDIYGFLGPNGAGKSTTLRIILGLVYKSAGSVQLFGNEIPKSDRSYLNKIGALIERPDFYNDLSAFDNLKLLGHLHQPKISKARIEEVLEMVNLHKQANKKFKTFSQGMKQRLGIAQAILHHPELVILDEPSNGLDPQGQIDMLKIIQDINQKMGITVIFSSHILSEVEAVSNQMVIINHGQSLLEGDVKSLIQAQASGVQLRVDHAETASTILTENQIQFTQRDGSFNFNADDTQVPKLLEQLANNGAQIQEVKGNVLLNPYS